jgi:chemotaxis family two-component system response regulator Rcp1
MNLPVFNILIVEDNPADLRLAQTAFKNSQSSSVLHIARDGVLAMEFLRRTGKYVSAPKPSLILLDLNLPRKDGRDVLAEIKSDPLLRRIPVIILTTSRAELDIDTCYDLHANGYIVKPTDVDQYFEMIQTTQQFWLTVATRSSP